MKKLFLIICLALLGSVAYSQNVIRKGNEFVQVSQKKTKETYKATSYTFTTSDGTKYPIYISEKGKYFIILTSKKTGKQYRRYLPEVTKQLSK
jgi:hypothetical protein